MWGDLCSPGPYLGRVEGREEEEKEGGQLGRVSVATLLMGFVVCSYLLSDLCGEIFVLQVHIWGGLKGEREKRRKEASWAEYL